MLCGTDEQWAALARLHDGIGTIADRHMLAENFREAYLVEQLDAMRKTNAGILADLPANSAPILEGASA